MSVLSEPNPAIAPPFSLAVEDVKLHFLNVALSPYNTIAPPSDSDVHSVNEQLMTVMLSDWFPTYIAPPSTEIHL